LILREITFLPPSPATSDNVTFTMTVGNDGKTAADDFSIACYIDGEYLDLISGGRLEPGNSANYSFTWVAALGDHRFRAMLDPFDRIIEAEERNNEMSAFIAVARNTQESLSSSDEEPASGRDNTPATIPERTGSGFDIGKSNLMFFSLLGLGLAIVLSFIVFEYRRRRR
jgi:hypothetical protein